MMRHPYHHETALHHERALHHEKVLAKSHLRDLILRDQI